jgi:hypothetical protein
MGKQMAEEQALSSVEELEVEEEETEGFDDEGQTVEEKAPGKYELAPEVETIARKLIEKYHGHLTNAKIIYLFRTGNWSTRHRETWGQVKKITGETKLLTGEDFRFILHKEVWEQLNEKDREAYIDHYLESMCEEEDSLGNPKYFIQGPDFVGFLANIKRFGLWNPELKKVKENLMQGKLFDESGKVNDNVIPLQKAVNE